MPVGQCHSAFINDEVGQPVVTDPCSLSGDMLVFFSGVLETIPVKNGEIIRILKIDPFEIVVDHARNDRLPWGIVRHVLVVHRNRQIDQRYAPLPAKGFNLLYRHVILTVHLEIITIDHSPQFIIELVWFFSDPGSKTGKPSEFEGFFIVKGILSLPVFLYLVLVLIDEIMIADRRWPGGKIIVRREQDRCRDQFL